MTPLPGVTSAHLCNICGLRPKYPSQGLCKECYRERTSKQYRDKRPPLIPVINLPDEEWKELEQAPGYQISSYGRIKSMNYYDELGRQAILKLRQARKGGYLKADLDKYNWRPSVHRLVAQAFIPNPNNYPVVLHIDEDKQNNHVSNLKWGTRSKNTKDYFNSLRKKGIKIQKNKLTKEEVLDIYHSGLTQQELALKFNINASTVWMIKTGYRWAKVTGAHNTDKRIKNEIIR